MRFPTACCWLDHASTVGAHFNENVRSIALSQRQHLRYLGSQSAAVVHACSGMHLRKKLATNMAPLITHSGALVSIKNAHEKHPLRFDSILSRLLRSTTCVDLTSLSQIRASHGEELQNADAIPLLGYC